MAMESLILKPDPRRAIKKETIDRDWVYNQACRLSHNIHDISQSFALIKSNHEKKAF